MRGKGITYDTGFISDGMSTREPFDPEIVKREMRIIRDDLHCNTVRITGGHPDRLEIAASYAADVGLEVWFSPFTNDLTIDDLLDLLADCAERAERLRKRGAEVVFVTGAELSLFNKGFLPGDTLNERLGLPDAATAAARVDSGDPRSHERLPWQGRDARSRAFWREDQLCLAPVRWRRLDTLRLRLIRCVSVEGGRRSVPRRHPYPCRAGKARRDHRVRVHHLSRRSRPGWTWLDDRRMGRCQTDPTGWRLLSRRERTGRHTCAICWTSSMPKASTPRSCVPSHPITCRTVATLVRTLTWPVTAWSRSLKTTSVTPTPTCPGNPRPRSPPSRTTTAARYTYLTFNFPFNEEV